MSSVCDALALLLLLLRKRTEQVSGITAMGDAALQRKCPQKQYKTAILPPRSRQTHAMRDGSTY